MASQKESTAWARELLAATAAGRTEGHNCAGAGYEARDFDGDGGAGQEGREDGGAGRNDVTAEEGCAGGVTAVGGGSSLLAQDRPLGEALAPPQASLYCCP